MNTSSRSSVPRSAWLFRLAACCLGLVLSVGLIRAQGAAGSLSGKVTGPKGAPLAGATITLAPGLEAATDREGDFYFGSVPPGSYTAQIVYLGLPSKDRAVTIGPGQPASLTATLGDDVIQLQAFTVEGTRGGQAKALNTQRSSENLKEIVASDAIGRFPDANASESLQRMSGIATVTARYVALVAGTQARVVDTRKTTPGLRRLEKYAVTCGGGRNHRFGLSDGILIKDNHIAAAGGIKQAVSAAKKQAPHTLKIEVEVSNTAQLEEALAAGADAVLLDNMGLETLAECVRITEGRVPLEASGGVDESTVASIAQTGVDLISVGALTHSVRAMDISLNFV